MQNAKKTMPKGKHFTLQIIVILVTLILLGISTIGDVEHGIGMGDYLMERIMVPQYHAENGETFVRPTYACVCDFTIINESEHGIYAYLKYLGEPEGSDECRTTKIDSSTQQSDGAFYVEKGRTATMAMPIGRYALYYATGDIFYGKESLFGLMTNTYLSDNTVSLYCTYSEPYHSLAAKYRESGSESEQKAAANALVAAILHVDTTDLSILAANPQKYPQVASFASMSFEELQQAIPAKVFHGVTTTITSSAQGQRNELPT